MPKGNRTRRKRKSLRLILVFLWSKGGLLSQRQKNISIPGAIQIQTLILVAIAVAHIHTRGVHAQQHPREIGAAGTLRGNARDDRRSACAAVHRGIRQEISLSLKTYTERRSDHGLSRHWQMMQVVVKTQRKTDDQHGSSH